MSVSEVPPVADPFVARELVRHEMLAEVRRQWSDGRTSLLNVHGVEGLGVSCLVSRFHRDNRKLLGDMLVWLTGRRADGKPTPPRELFVRLLRQLGVGEADQDATEADLAMACRRLLAQRAFVIVIDDLAAPAQVEPLLGVDTPHGGVIVVTTPLVRRDLIVRGFREFSPEFLEADDARTLFVNPLGESVGQLAAHVVDELVGQCGGIPLLLKILSAQLVGRPHLAEPLLIELRTARLDLLALDDERRMSRFLDVAYERLAELPGDLATAYRRLSVLPGGDFGVEVAAAALGRLVTTTVVTLEGLADHNLLVRPDQHRGDRYAFHPVVHADARARANEIDDHAILDRAAGVAVRWYTREALARAAVLSGRWWVDSVTRLMASLFPDGVPTFARDEAEAWFELEGDNVVAAVGVAAKHGVPELVVPLCVALWSYLHPHRLVDAWIETHREGVEVARLLGDLAGEMQVTSQLGSAYLDAGETGLARERFAAALAAARALSERDGLSEQAALGEQSNLEWVGKCHAAEDQHTEARAYFGRSWEFTEAAGDLIDASQRERVFALLRLQTARSAVAVDERAEALDGVTPAAAFFDRFGEPQNQAKCQLVIGRARLGLGNARAAARAFEEAVSLFGRARRRRAEACEWLARALAAAGERDLAVRWCREALDYYEEVASARADEVGRLLTDLTT